MDKVVRAGSLEFKVSNLEKIFWPESRLTKADLIKYYMDISDVIMGHLRKRPLVMKRYPDGIDGQFFYQKDCPGYAPDWIETYSVRHSEKNIDYIVCNEPATLFWLANKGCIEVHAWLALIENIECPDIAVMDLDPSEGSELTDVVEVALLCRKAMHEFGLEPLVKTSGSRGLHIFVPIENRYPYAWVAKAMQYIADLIVSVYPKKATTERTIAKRKGKVYLDYLQNGRGKTMAFQYSLRPLPGAPVSTPLLWEEVESKKIKPINYNIRTIFERLDKHGDIMADLQYKRCSLEKLLSAANNFHFQEKSKGDKYFHNEQEILW